MMLETVVSRLLKGYGIPSCIIGELALNCYNVPRVLFVRTLGGPIQHLFPVQD